MFNSLERKVNSTIYTLFLVGLLCVGLGVITLLSDFFVRFLLGLLFFLFAYATLHLAYRIQVIRDSINAAVHLKKSPSARKK